MNDIDKLKHENEYLKHRIEVEHGFMELWQDMAETELKRYEKLLEAAKALKIAARN